MTNARKIAGRINRVLTRQSAETVDADAPLAADETVTLVLDHDPGRCFVRCQARHLPSRNVCDLEGRWIAALVDPAPIYGEEGGSYSRPGYQMTALG